MRGKERGREIEREKEKAGERKRQREGEGGGGVGGRGANILFIFTNLKCVSPKDNYKMSLCVCHRAEGLVGSLPSAHSYTGY